MSFKGKKGISALVATVLLILITIAAVGIIWGAVMPMINENMKVGQACLKAKLEINTLSGYTCFNASENRTLVNIGRGSEVYTLDGIAVSISGQGRTTTFNVNSSGTGPNVVNISGYGLPNPAEDRTYKVDTGANWLPEKVSVSALIKVGAVQKMCDPSGEAVLAKCS